MATKPVTSPPIWASNANWASGPHTGVATKVAPSAGQAQNGHVGGESYKGQFQNYVDNLLTTWVATWLALGSAAGAEDAHIVETDATGVAAVAQITVPGRAAGTVGIQATGTPGAGPATGMRGIGVGAAPGVSGIGGNGAMTGSGDTYSGGVGVRGISGTSINSSGVLGIGLAGVTLAGNGVEGRGSLGGMGILGTGGASGHGVRGLVPVGGTGYGGEFVGGLVALHAIADAATNARAVHGVINPGGAVTAAAIFGEANDTAIGVWGQSEDGYGVVAESDQTSPTRSALRLEPQNADPGTALVGDVYCSDENIGGLTADELRMYRRGAWHSLATVRYGYVKAFASTSSTTSHSATGSWTSALTVTLAAPDEPRRTGTVWIRFSGEVGRAASGATNNIQVRINDTTAAAVVAGTTKTITLLQGASIFERHFVYLVGYALPAAGARSFDLEITTTVNTEGARIRDAAIEVYGVV